MSAAADEVTALLAELIGIDTTSSGSNLELIDFARGLCDPLGLATTVQPSPAGQKANLIITAPDVHGRRTGGAVLWGHTDTVPTTGQPWASDPYEARFADGRVYGRGTADMKGFLACALSLLPRLATMRLREPVRVVLSYDEELWCRGAAQLVPVLAAEDRPIELCLVGEPTGMRLVRAHKSGTVGRLRVSGIAGHSSDPDAGVNAIGVASDFVQLLERLARELRAEPEPGFAVPFSTINVGTIAGGIATNIVAADCELSWELRTVRPEHVRQVLDAVEGHVAAVNARLSEHHPGARLAHEVSAHVPGLQPAALPPWLEDAIDAESSPHVAFGTEAGLLCAAGIPAVVCGPGNISEAHIADEYVEISQLEECRESLIRLIDALTDDAE
ncbi:acetylornithine deacetylase [Gryllotalpicola koreensis]|uniref:Acetylornithine deacetylase n=1 Tax=Gryllotalpicola koreensis TaxID=993086 RepID=A0ABP8ACL6_9MICO